MEQRGVVVEAADQHLIEPILVGPEQRIRAVAADNALDVSKFEIVDAEHSHSAAAKAVETLRDEGFDVELRGALHSPYVLTVGEMARVDVYVPDDQVDDAPGRLVVAVVPGKVMVSVEAGRVIVLVTVWAGAVSVTVSAGAVSVTVSPGAVTVLVVPGAVTVSVTVSPGAVSVTVSVTVSPGAVSVSVSVTV